MIATNYSRKLFPGIYLRQEYWATLILVVDFWVVAIKDIYVRSGEFCLLMD
jgi:hypothetical protein